MARAPLPPDLTDEVRALIAPHLEPDATRLSAIARILCDKRKEAKEARAASGIEQIWQACEEAYIGIDDANRGKVAAGRWEKPLSPEGPLTRDRVPRGDDTKSSAFVRLTARYVDAGAAKLAEILLPIDDKAFKITETPLPELIPFKDDTSHVTHETLGPLWRPARQGETPAAPPAGNPAPDQAPAPVAAPAGGAAPPPGALPTMPQMGAAMAGVQNAPQPPPGMVPLTPKDVVEEQQELAAEKAEKAERRIYDWLVECKYRRHGRRLIKDSAKLGVGVLKGPYAKPSKGMAVSAAQDGGIDVVFRENIKPAVKRIDPWNIFPDPACGEEIADGEYLFERDYLTERQVRQLKKAPGYISAEIDAVIQEGPDKVKVRENGRSQGEPQPSATASRYEVWYFTGFLTREDLSCICEAGGRTLSKDAVPEDQLEVPVVVTMINDHVVKAALAMLDSGALPYHNMPWQERDGHWAGIGVAEQIATPQAMVNAGTRAVLNNAGLAAGPQIVIDIGAVRPADGRWQITPNKVWYAGKDDSAATDVTTAFHIFEMPNVVAQIMAVIEYGMRQGEESTSIPLVTQGMSGPTQPDTLGGLQLQNNNANQLLRSIGYDYDDYITEPVVKLFYEWLLIDPNVPNDEKGDFTINAHGSAALVERAIQDQILPQLLPASINPAYKLDPAKTMEELLKSKRFDPRMFKRSEAEQAKIDAAGPAPDPRIQAAQIAAQGRIDAAKIAAKAVEDRILADGQIAVHNNKAAYDLAVLEYSLKHNTTIEQVKAQLAQTAMKLDTEKELHAADVAADAAKGRAPRAPRRQRTPAPPVQTPGRAGNGRAFEQGPG